MPLFEISSSRARFLAGSAVSTIAICTAFAEGAQAQSVGNPSTWSSDGTWSSNASATAGSITSDAATAVFSIAVVGSATYLDVTLTNTSNPSSWTVNNVLTGVFFDSATLSTTVSSNDTAVSNGALANSSACTGTGSATICASSTPNVAREWAVGYKSTGYGNSTNGYFNYATTTTPKFGIGTLVYAPGGTKNGTFNIDNGGPLWNGSNSTSAANPINGSTAPQLWSSWGSDTVAFGLVNSSYTGGTAISQVSPANGIVPLVTGSVTFGLALPTNTTSVNISNVWFTFGYSPNNALQGVHTPEPSTLALMGSGLVGYRLMRRRRAHNANIKAKIAA